MFKLKRRGLYGGDVTQKSLYFIVLKNPSITGTFWDAVSRQVKQQGLKNCIFDFV